MKTANGKEAEIQFNVAGPLLSLEQMKAAYVLHVYETVSGRNITLTAKLLQSTRVTTRKLVDLGTDDRTRCAIKAARDQNLWPDFDCPKCGAEAPWEGRRLKWGVPEIFCSACDYAPYASKEETGECPDTPTSSRSP